MADLHESLFKHSNKKKLNMKNRPDKESSGILKKLNNDTFCENIVDDTIASPPKKKSKLTAKDYHQTFPVSDIDMHISKNQERKQSVEMDNDIYDGLDYLEFSGDEYELEQYKKSSITDAVKDIMSQGGQLDETGALVRTPKTRKKKNKKRKYSGITNCKQNGSSQQNGGGHTLVPVAVCKETTITGCDLKDNLCSKTLKIDYNKLLESDSVTLDDSLQSITLSKSDVSSVDVVTCSKRNKRKICTSTQDMIVKDKNVDAKLVGVEEPEIVSNGINPEYLAKPYKKMIKRSWIGDSAMEQGSGGHRLLQMPFNCALLPDFVSSSSSLLPRLREELKELRLAEKNNDMYKFHQTAEELPLSGACLELRELLVGPVRKWLRRVTGIPLNTTVALSASVYQHTDVLVCHDDELEGRRIAFILYLTEEEWRPRDGGSLDVFSADELGRPGRVVERMYPRHNSFAFFEVSPVSFHQVSEVLSREKVRLSVNGWFHGPDIVRPPKPAPALKYFRPHCHVKESLLYSWISPLYLAESTQTTIRSQFKKDSEIFLEDFIPEEKYAALCEALASIEEEQWQWVGPPCVQHYQVTGQQSAPAIVKEFLRVMRSEAMFLVMSQLTGLSLHRLAPESDDDQDEDSEEGDSDDGSEQCSDDSDVDGVDMDGEAPVAARKVKATQNKTLKSLLKKHDKDVKKFRKQELEKKSKKKKRNMCGLDQDWIADAGDDTIKEIKAPSSGDSGGLYTSVRRVRHGCYSVIRDDDNSSSSSSFLLDAFLFCNVPGDWRDEWGGYRTYVARDDKDELLSVSPRSNSLALVYRDADTFSFMKHVNSTAGDASYHCVTAQYK